MTDKKEIQITILPNQDNSNGKATEDELLNVLKMVSPGTHLRTAIDGALKTGKGALIVVENDRLLPLLDGGFRVNCRFTPQRLIELTKMDGAIILSKDIKRINFANVLLTPDSKIETSETGTRHKAAERTAKQIAGIVIAISERKNEINVFFKNIKYPLKTTEQILRKANEQVQILEKQRELFDKNLDKLTRLEIKNYPSLSQSLSVMQKGRFIQKIAEDLKRHIIELGNEGTLMKTRLKELTNGVEREMNLVIKDYTKLNLKKTRVLLESLSYDDLLDEENILKSLAYETKKQISPIKGWRILSKTSLEEAEIANLVKQVEHIGKALHSNIKEIEPILGEERAKVFKEEIDKIKLNP